MIRRGAFALVAAGVALAVPATAMAASPSPGGRIQQVSGSNGKLAVVFTAVGLTAGQTVDPASVRLTVDGQPVTSTASLLNGSTSVQQTAVLAMDTSGSMAGAGIRGAKAAALEFLSVVP